LSNLIRQELVETLASRLPFPPIPHLLVQVALTFDRAVLELAGPGAKLARYGFGKAFEI
jgi:hypothetical protein